MKRFTLKHLEKLLIAFVFVILLSAVAYFFSFRQTLKIVTEKVDNYTYAMLEQTRAVVDNKWEQFQSIAYEVSHTSPVKQHIYATLPLPNDKYYSLWDIQKTLRPYVTDDYLEDVGVYFIRSDTIITSSESLRLSKFYDYYFTESYANFKSFNQTLASSSLEGIFLEPAVIAGASGSKTKVLPYVLPFPTAYSPVTDGYIILFIDIEKLDYLLQQMDVLKEGNVYIKNNDTTVWSLINNETIVQPQVTPAKSTTPYKFYKQGKTIIASLTSPTSGWTYSIEVPSKILLDQEEYLKSSLTLFLLMSLLALGIGAVTSIHTMRPVDKIISLVSGEQEKNRRINEFAYLEYSIAQLIENHEDLQITLRQHHNMLEQEFFRNLYQNEYTSLKEIKQVLVAMDVSLKGETFLVVIAAIAEGEELLLSSESQFYRNQSDGQLVLTQLVQNMDQEGVIQSCLLERNRVIFLMASPKENAQLLQRDAQEFFVSVKRTMFQQYGVFISLFAGEVQQSLENIPTSFSKALSTYEYYWDSEESKDIYWASSIPLDGHSQRVSIAAQERLYNLTIAGKSQELEELLETIYQENFLKTRYPLAERVQLLIELRGVLLRLYEKFKLDHALFHIYIEDCNTGNDEVFHRISQYFQSLSNMSNQMRTEKSLRLKESIEQFIKENFTEPSLSLTMICSQFSIGEAALSQFFKEQTGQTISQYIERLRMNKASDLLAEKDVPIGEIALQVGYSSDKSFRRAFKRVHAITPSEYRKNKKVERK